MKKINLKDTNGITLITLVITIIVLAILAGVTVTALTGEKSVIKEANDAKSSSEQQSAKEKVQAAVLGAIKKNGEVDVNVLNKKLGTNIIDLPAGVNINGIEIRVGLSGTVSGTYELNDASDLYDKNNNQNDSSYKQDAMHIGDWVDYNAGAWTESKKLEIQTPGALVYQKFQFGGYKAGQSRNTNNDESEIGMNNTTEYGKSRYSGWRIWDIASDNKTITLISAGCPEAYCQEFGANNGYKSQFIFTGSKNSSDTSNITDGVTPRDWSVYVNRNQYATSAKALNQNEANTWYSKNVDSTKSQLPYISDLPSVTGNKLVSMIENGSFYWFATTQDNSALPFFVPVRNYINRNSTRIYGVRVLVQLSSDAKFNKTPQKVQNDGFTYNKWSME